VLIEGLQDREAEVREAAAAGIGDLGPAAWGAESKVRELLKDPDQGVRNVAGKTPERISPAD
jgi:HEAT repeat protein